jgi:hypothetical protein
LKLTGWPVGGEEGEKVKFASSPPGPPPPPIEIVFDPETPEQPGFVAVTSLLPVVLQVIAIELVLLAPEPSAKLHDQAFAEGAQLEAEALKV